MDTPIKLTEQEEDAIKSLKVKVRNLRFLEITNICDLSEDEIESLEAKKLIACQADGWFFTPEGRVIRDMLFPENL